MTCLLTACDQGKAKTMCGRAGRHEVKNDAEIEMKNVDCIECVHAYAAGAGMTPDDLQYFAKYNRLTKGKKAKPKKRNNK